MTTPGGFTDAAAIRAEAMAAGAHAEAVTPLSESDVRKLFGPPVEPPRPPIAYRLGLLFVAVATVVLPLLYVALVASVVALTLWFAVATIDTVTTGFSSIRNYVGRIVVGSLLVVFLVKPMFAKRRRTVDAPSLSPDEEPVLHAFVRHVCTAVGAPLPTRIDIDGEVNASASFRRGWRSFFGTDLVLTIGTPLFAGMTVAELGGILAHEMGHFRQGWGMRLSFAIRTTNAWLHRVVHERDGWDEKLKNVGGWVWAATLARGCIWVTRRLLWLLMRIGQFLASTMSRQMELDADRHELALVGPTVLVTSLRKLVLLSETQDAAYETASAALRDGMLPDDLTTLTLDFRSRMKDDFARKLLESALERDTEALASHPGTRDRIAHAEAHGGSGPLRCDVPATALLADPVARQRQVTRAHYEVVAPGSLPHVAVVPTQRLLSDNRQAQADQEISARTYRDTVAYVLPLRLDTLPEVATDVPSLVEALGEARTAFESASSDAQRALSRFDQADTRIAHAHRIESLLAAGGDPDELHDLVVDDRTAEGAVSAQVSARAGQRRPRETVELAHAALRRRIACASALVHEHRTELGLDDQLARRFDRALGALRALSGQVDLLDEMRFDSYALVDLAKHRAGKDDLKARDAVAQAELSARKRFATLQTDLADVPHPVEADALLIDRLFADRAGAEARPLDRVGPLLDDVWVLYFRGLDVLARVVDRVEAACASIDDATETN